MINKTVKKRTEAVADISTAHAMLMNGRFLDLLELPGKILPFIQASIWTLIDISRISHYCSHG